MANFELLTFASADGSSYRYHNLFREFLRRKSAQEDGPLVKL